MRTYAVCILVSIAAVTIEVSGISFNVTNQVIDTQIVLLFYIGLYFSSQSFKC